MSKGAQGDAHIQILRTLCEQAEELRQAAAALRAAHKADYRNTGAIGSQICSG